jgi:hypothetical protein
MMILVRGEEKTFWNVLNLLQLFLLIIGLEINWENSIAY